MDVIKTLNLFLYFVDFKGDPYRGLMRVSESYEQHHKF